MRVATPRVDSGTWIRRYLMNDLLLHLPIIWIVSTFTPARYIAMAAPDLIECVPMSAASNPSRRLPIALVAVRSCSSTAVDDRYFVSSSAVLGSRSLAVVRNPVSSTPDRRGSSLGIRLLDLACHFGVV
jgi:hypothetical protein